TDVKLYKSPPSSAPVIMGHENIGVIAKAGREFVRRKGFKEGDLVFVEHHVPKGVSAELAGLVTPMANGVEWSLFDGGVGYNSTVLIQGPGQQGLSQTVICKQAGASLIIVTGTSKDEARLRVAKELGADFTINVQNEDPLAR